MHVDLKNQNLLYAEGFLSQLFSKILPILNKII